MSNNTQQLYRWTKANKVPPPFPGFNWKSFTCRLIGQPDVPTFVVRAVKTKNHFYWETPNPELMEYLEELPLPSNDAEQQNGFQNRVNDWMQQCFGPEISKDWIERNHRFLEESLELVQSLGCTHSEAHQLVDYVFNRPIGEPIQECGGVMVTLAALGLAADLDINGCGEIELHRIWGKIDDIRQKQANKPKHSPLPAETNTLEADCLKIVQDNFIPFLHEAEYKDCAKKMATLIFQYRSQQQVDPVKVESLLRKLSNGLAEAKLKDSDYGLAVPPEDIETIIQLFRARQMSVPTNDQRNIFSELVKWAEEKEQSGEGWHNGTIIPAEAFFKKVDQLLSRQKEMDGKVTREESEYPIGGFAPGNYYCKCCSCDAQFRGDKRAVQCEPCARKYFASSFPEPTDTPIPIDPLKARGIAEKAIEWAEDNYTITYNKSTGHSKQIYLDTHYPIEKEGDDKADNQ